MYMHPFPGANVSYSLSDSRIIDKASHFCLRFLPSGSCSQALSLLTVFLNFISVPIINSE